MFCVDLWDKYRFIYDDDGMFLINEISEVKEYRVIGIKNEHQLNVEGIDGAKYESGYIEKFKAKGFYEAGEQHLKELFPEWFI
ncbi:hypothetical protein B5X20_RS22850 [Vibrio parahaemolyticus]|nr:hypothetical protein [Vibrio parahaemolyticus]